MRLPTTLLFLLGATLLSAGCSSEPRAPALGSEAVFVYDPAGLRFLAPDGWIQMSRSNPPPGPRTKPTRIVAYFVKSGARGASFDLYETDLKQSDDLVAYLNDNPIGPEKWKLKEKPTTETISDNPVTRAIFLDTQRKTELRREVVAFHRPEHTYLFVLTAPSNETSAVGQFQRCINSVRWK